MCVDGLVEEMEPAIVSVTNDSDTSSGHVKGIERLGEPEEGLVALSAFLFSYRALTAGGPEGCCLPNCRIQYLFSTREYCLRQ